MLKIKIKRVFFPKYFWKLGVYGEESGSKNLSPENPGGVLWESLGTGSGKTRHRHSKGSHLHSKH